jgi:hypothetical protein
MLYRTDRNNNPTAFTTDVAKEAGLIEGTDYAQGEGFVIDSKTYFTARLLGDPIEITIKVIDKLGFRTVIGRPRWSYIDSQPSLVFWDLLSYAQKIRIIAFMYAQEGGVFLNGLFTKTLFVDVEDGVSPGDSLRTQHLTVAVSDQVKFGDTTS